MMANALKALCWWVNKTLLKLKKMLKFQLSLKLNWFRGDLLFLEHMKNTMRFLQLIKFIKFAAKLSAKVNHSKWKTFPWTWILCTILFRHCRQSNYFLSATQSIHIVMYQPMCDIPLLTNKQEIFLLFFWKKSQQQEK